MNVEGVAFCEGTLIGSHWVLTTESCVPKASRSTIKIRHQTGEEIPITAISCENSICILQIIRRFHFTTVPMCLPDKEEINQYSRCYSASFDARNDVKDNPIPVLSNERCAQRYDFALDDSEFCAGWDNSYLGTVLRYKSQKLGFSRKI